MPYIKNPILILGFTTCMFLIIVSLFQPDLHQAVQQSMGFYDEESLHLSRYLRTARPYTGAGLESLIEENSPNLPYSFWLKQQKVSSRRVKCGKIPNIYSINWSGEMWQVFTGKRTKMYIYSAYIDDRSKDGPKARVIALLKQVRQTLTQTVPKLEL